MGGRAPFGGGLHWNHAVSSPTSIMRGLSSAGGSASSLCENRRVLLVVPETGAHRPLTTTNPSSHRHWSPSVQGVVVTSGISVVAPTLCRAVVTGAKSVVATSASNVLLCTIVTQSTSCAKNGAAAQASQLSSRTPPTRALPCLPALWRKWTKRCTNFPR